jgi:glycine/D-amino acid oxidase-like deaminating enzyme
MAPHLRIVGQGLAGSLLAWRALKEGCTVELFDSGHARSASRVGAGIINPVTGQRLVKSWRVDEFLPRALATYRELEHELRLPLLQSFRVRRLFRSEAERRTACEKFDRGDLRPFVSSIDAGGAWIEPAYRVDTARLIETLRQRWLRQGLLHETTFPDGDFSPQNASSAPGTLTVWCRGAGELASPRFRFAPLSPARGEIISLETTALDPATILNAGFWLVPTSATRARLGATFEPGVSSGQITPEARQILEAAARVLLSRPFEITAQETGLRVTVSDKHPVIGRHPSAPQHGIFNGLGSKGALLAPFLAGQWCAHFLHAAPLDPAVDVSRFTP